MTGWSSCRRRARCCTFPRPTTTLADRAVTAAHRAFLGLAARRRRRHHAVLRGVRATARGRRVCSARSPPPTRRTWSGPGRWAAAPRAWCCPRRCGRTWCRDCARGATCRRDGMRSWSGSTTRAGGWSSGGPPRRRRVRVRGPPQRVRRCDGRAAQRATRWCSASGATPCVRRWPSSRRRSCPRWRPPACPTAPSGSSPRRPGRPASRCSRTRSWRSPWPAGRARPWPSSAPSPGRRVCRSACTARGEPGWWPGPGADADRFERAVFQSLDRKVCNTLNVCCIVNDRAASWCLASWLHWRQRGSGGEQLPSCTWWRAASRTCRGPGSSARSRSSGRRARSSSRRPRRWSPPSSAASGSGRAARR